MPRWLLAYAFLAVLLGHTAQAQTQPLRLAVAPNPSSAMAWLSISEGYLTKAGLTDVVLVPCVNGNECTRRLVAGEADVTLGADTSVVVALQSGAALSVLATVSESRRSNRMIARRTPSVQRPEDLRGLRIGYLPGTSSHYFSEAFMAFYGVGPQDVQWIALDPKRAVDQLAGAEVDAAALFPPNAQRALARLGDAGLEFPSPPVYTLSINVLAAPTLDAERGRRLLQALFQAEKRFRESPDEAWSAVGRRIRLTDDELAVARSDFTHRVHLDQSLIDSLEAQSRWAVRRGIGKNEVPNFLPFLRPELLESIEPRRVSVSR